MNKSLGTAFLVPFFSCFMFLGTLLTEITGNRFYKEKLILIFIDFSDISCSMCSDSLIKLNEFFNLNLSSTSKMFIIGILLYECPYGIESVRCEKIVEKQLKGFILTNEIRFPIVSDRSHVFEGLNIKRSMIIYFDQ